MKFIFSQVLLFTSVALLGLGSFAQQYPNDTPASARGPWKNPGFNYAHCSLDTLNGTSTPFNYNGQFRPECAPEVLYSWQTLPMLEHYTGQSTAKNILPLQRLFAWRTPLWLYPYGKAPLRLKLKPETRFINLPFSLRSQAYHRFGWEGERPRLQACQLWTKTLQTGPNTVFVSIHGDESTQDIQGVQEYIFCDSSAIESFSLLSPELLQEMQWELDQVLGYETASSLNRFLIERPVLTDSLPWLADHDNKDASQARLFANINWMFQSMKNPKYHQIYYNHGVTPDRDKHFSVRSPRYYLRRNDGASDQQITSIEFQVDHNKEGWQSLNTDLGFRTSCLNKQYCYWFLNPLESELNLYREFRVVWQCSGSEQFYAASMYRAKMQTMNGLRTPIINSLLNPHCPAAPEFTSEKEPPQKKQLIIDQALYESQNQQLDITKAVASFCNGKEICDYKVHRKFLNWSDFDREAQIQIRFHCNDDLKSKALVVSPPAEEQVWRLSCSSNPQRLR